MPTRKHLDVKVENILLIRVKAIIIIIIIIVVIMIIIE